jgi:thiopurine S-methyltransferase
MDSNFWHQCWERSSIGFHQDKIHPFLSEHLTKLRQPGDEHVFVPLCGKSLDLAFLAESMAVTGNELSDIACRDFFTDNNISFEKKTIEPFSCYSYDKITLWQGDFFKLIPDCIASVDWIYDRAALIALPKTMQQQYVDHLSLFFTEQTRMLLVTLEFPESQLTGPPFSVTGTAVSRLFSQFDVQYLASQELKEKQFAQRVFDVDYLVEKLYLIRKKAR